MTPERAAEVAEAFAVQWNSDWSTVIAGLMERTGLSWDHAFQYMALATVAQMRDQLVELRKPVYHDNCKACQQDREFHELQYEHMKLANKHMREEHGEDWQE